MLTTRLSPVVSPYVSRPFVVQTSDWVGDIKINSHVLESGMDSTLWGCSKSSKREWQSSLGSCDTLQDASSSSWTWAYETSRWGHGVCHVNVSSSICRRVREHFSMVLNDTQLFVLGERLAVFVMMFKISMRKRMWRCRSSSEIAIVSKMFSQFVRSVTTNVSKSRHTNTRIYRYARHILKWCHVMMFMEHYGPLWILNWNEEYFEVSKMCWCESFVWRRPSIRKRMKRFLST